MPRKAEWIQNLSEIQRQLEALPDGLLDRSLIERVFAVSSRQATRILHQLGASQAGGALLIEREECLQRLALLQGDATILFEQQRRERFEQRIEQARREARGRRVRIPAVGGEEFPAAVQLANGQLSVQFRDPVDLLQKLLWLAQTASDDWDGFEARASQSGAG